MTTNESTNLTGSARPSRRQLLAGGGAWWKSSLVAASVGAVLCGWAYLAHIDAVGIVPRVAPSTSTSQAVRTEGAVTVSPLPALPQKPIFVQPITRTRRS